MPVCSPEVWLSSCSTVTSPWPGSTPGSTSSTVVPSDHVPRSTWRMTSTATIDFVLLATRKRSPSRAVAGFVRSRTPAAPA